MLSTFKVYLAAVAVVGLVVSHGSAYFYGRSSGRDAVLNNLKDDRIIVLKDGQKVDEKVIGADDGALCALLGGCELPVYPIGN